MFGKNNIYTIVIACVVCIFSIGLSLLWDFQWEKLVVIGLLVIMLGATVYLITSLTEDLEEKPKKGECGVIIRQPKLHIALPLFITVGTLFFSAICVIFHGEGESGLEIALIFSIIGLIAVLVFIAFSLWKLEIGKDKFIYRNFLGITKIYFYKDMEMPDNFTCFINGKKVFRRPGYINTNLLYKVYKKYRAKEKSD